MNLYRVDFKNNKPVSATLIGFKHRDKIPKAEIMQENGIIKWLMILGLDEQDSINIAAEIADEIAGDIV